MPLPRPAAPAPRRALNAGHARLILDERDREVERVGEGERLGAAEVEPALLFVPSRAA
jgi:hypothetical protein